MRIPTKFKEITVGLGLSYYNSRKELPRCLGDHNNPRAICNNVDYIFAIDGKYDMFDAPNAFSNDGSTEYIKQTYANVIIEKFSGYQVDKRQKYFDLAAEYSCDYLIVMDSDDFIHPDFQDWQLFYKTLNYYSTKYPDERIFEMKAFIPHTGWEKAHNAFRSGMFRKIVRIHKKPEEQRYGLGRHYWFVRKDITDEEIIKNPNLKCQYIAKHCIDKGIRITTDSKQRTKAFLKSRDKWALQTMEREKKILYDLYTKYRAKEEGGGTPSYLLPNDMLVDVNTRVDKKK